MREENKGATRSSEVPIDVQTATHSQSPSETPYLCELRKNLGLRPRINQSHLDKINAERHGRMVSDTKRESFCISVFLVRKLFTARQLKTRMPNRKKKTTTLE